MWRLTRGGAREVGGPGSDAAVLTSALAGLPRKIERPVQPQPLASLSAEVILVDHRSAKGPTVSAVRGSLLVSAIERLKACGYHDRYLAVLSPTLREKVSFSLAMSWLPIELVIQHCQACDELVLSDAELQALGGETASSMARVMLGSLARNAGMTPLVALGSAGRVYDRIYEGGGVSVTRLGPKDLRLEQIGTRLAASRYFRVTTQGFYRSLCELFCKKAYVAPARGVDRGPDSYAVTVSWV